MLEDEGFTRSGLIDIFDGGPTVTAPRDQIRTVRNAQTLPAAAGVVEVAADERLHLVAVPGLATFRATLTPARITDDALVVPEATLAALGIRPGDPLIVS
nr:arginine N-succinyltransferase [Novosphingobium capsulatum]